MPLFLSVQIPYLSFILSKKKESCSTSTVLQELSGLLIMYISFIATCLQLYIFLKKPIFYHIFLQYIKNFYSPKNESLKK